jgi:hypothetical protein
MNSLTETIFSGKLDGVARARRRPPFFSPTVSIAKSGRKESHRAPLRGSSGREAGHGRAVSPMPDGHSVATTWTDGHGWWLPIRLDRTSVWRDSWFTPISQGSRLDFGRVNRLRAVRGKGDPGFGAICVRLGLLERPYHAVGLA